MKIGMLLPMNESDGPGADGWPGSGALALLAEAVASTASGCTTTSSSASPVQPEDGILEAWTILAAWRR